VTTALLVHGLWHGAWTWRAVRAELNRVGVDSVAVELPLTSLADDVAAVESSMDSTAGDVVLVGHSYGGAVITAVPPRPATRALLYLAAYQLAEDESMMSVGAGLKLPTPALASTMDVDPHSGSVTLTAAAREILYNDVPADVAAAAMAQLRPCARALFRAVPGVASWRTIPSTYVVCTRDRAIPPVLQRHMAERADKTVEWPVGHSPAAACPAEVAVQIEGLL